MIDGDVFVLASSALSEPEELYHTRFLDLRCKTEAVPHAFAWGGGAVFWRSWKNEEMQTLEVRRSQTVAQTHERSAARATSLIRVEHADSI